MDWFKKNRETSQALLVAIVISAVGGYFWWHEGQRVSSLNTDLESQAMTLSRYRGQSVFPSEANTKVYQEKAQQLESYLQPAIAELKQGQIQGEALNPIDFQTEFRNTRDRLVEMAQKARNPVTLPENFSFGFGRYLTSIPAPEATVFLTQELRIIERLTQLLFESGINELKSVSRLPVEDLLTQSSGAAAATRQPVRGSEGELGELLPAMSLDREGLFYRTLPFVFQFVGTDTSLRKIVDALNERGGEGQENGAQPFWIVRSLEVINERGEPPTVEDLKTKGATSEGPKSVAANLILGEETIRITMRIDYINWQSDENVSVKK
ncbi:MAG: Amuc_1100 family pilus-like protein [Verrucomicrobiae bacterium]|nr:Amuc_1100 family pilus-like protein [Verrucomicrobiae bacterium]